MGIQRPVEQKIDAYKKFSQNLAPNPTNKAEKNARKIGTGIGTGINIASSFIAPEAAGLNINKVAGLEAASPVIKFAGYSGIRGAENAGYGLISDLGNGSSFKDATKNIPKNIAIGAGTNAVLSPVLTTQAGKELVGNYKDLRVKQEIEDLINPYARKIAESNDFNTIRSILADKNGLGRPYSGPTISAKAREFVDIKDPQVIGKDIHDSIINQINPPPLKINHFQAPEYQYRSPGTQPGFARLPGQEPVNPINPDLINKDNFKLGEIINNKDLFSKYPGIQNIDIRLTNDKAGILSGGNNGSYIRLGDKGRISIGKNGWDYVYDTNKIGALESIKNDIISKIKNDQVAGVPEDMLNNKYLGKLKDINNQIDDLKTPKNAIGKKINEKGNSILVHEIEHSKQHLQGNAIDNQPYHLRPGENAAYNAQKKHSVNNPINALDRTKLSGKALDTPNRLLEPSLNTNDYLQQQIAKQQAASRIENPGLKSKLTSGIADIKRKLVDSTAPIEDVLYKAKKAGADIKPSEDITNQIDRVYRSRGLAAQFAKDNGLVDAIKGAPDINKLDQYLIAKHTADVTKETGRNATQDAQLVKDLAPEYEPYAQKVVQYGQKLLDYAQQSGLVSSSTVSQLKKQYPNYVPLKRVFNEVEQGVNRGTGSGVASLSSQNVVQKMKGSTRQISNPTESLLTKTLDAFNQGERNIAGKQLASYKDLPAFKGLITEVKPGESNPHTFSYLDNGVKRTFATTPEISQAAKLLDKQQMGFIGKLFAAPVRVARLGITGLNVPFVAANAIKDQVTGAINTDHALATSIANPKVFVKSLWSAVGHGKEYQDWIRAGGGGTSFDIAREAPKATVDQIRSNRNVGSKIAYTVTHPGDLFRAAENAIGRSEELTRMQQFLGTKQELLKKGMDPKEAEILAAKASRENTTNFARSGDWGKALNSAFLYLNAGIQGSRTLVRNVANKPGQTVAKIGLTVLTPIATATAWNLADPKRKAAYDDIADFEKQNNLILVPPNPTKDPQTGKWNVIKIPYSQEIANLTDPVRKGVESMYGYDKPGFSDIAKGLLGTATSLNVQTPQQLVGQFIPQAVKPPIESLVNKNLFTGNDIVPQYLNGQVSKNLPANMQVRDNTSGTARMISKPFNTSPIKTEQLVKDTFGGLGSNVLNASDRLLARAGAIPKSQIGGQSITDGLKSRITEATGGQQLSNLFDNKTVKGATKVAGPNTNSDNIVQNKGKYYVSFGKNNVKSFDSPQSAKLAIENNKFGKSKSAYQVSSDGQYVFTRDRNGKPNTPTPKIDYDYKVNTAKLTQQKKARDIKGYLVTSQVQLAILDKKLKDPSIDPLEAVSLQNKAQTIIDNMNKYSSYGGFKKPKAGKVNSPGSLASLTSPTKSSFSAGKVSAPKAPSPVRSTIKVAKYVRKPKNNTSDIVAKLKRGR